MYGRAALADDDELLRRWRAGDRAAGSELCGRHHADAHRFARRLGRGVADADDIVAEAFAKVLRAMLGGLGPRDGFRRYLFAAVRSCAFDAHRASIATTDQVPDVHEDGGFDQVASVGSPMFNAFAELPERARQVLWMLEVEGWSAGEVARANGSTPGAVSALAYRSRTQLRRRYLAHLAAARDLDAQPGDGAPRAVVAEAADAAFDDVVIDVVRDDVVIDLTEVATVAGLVEVPGRAHQLRSA